VTAHAITGLLPPMVQPVAGRILFEGQDILRLSPPELRALRGAKIAMIFQEPMTALNPVMKIGAQIAEMFEAHGALDNSARRKRALALLREVALPDPEKALNVYPHELSGGQRQRVMIAMALALEPKVLIADEPTTALDVTTQAQILKLMKQLKDRHGTTVLFITHDFGVVAEIADRVAVMQHGKIVETGTAADVLRSPKHPYTQALLAAVPSLRPPDRPAFRTDAPIALDVDGLIKTYRGRGLFRRRVVHAVADVTFALRRGETLGIVGESGSGKSTLGRCVIKLIHPDGGTIRLAGTDISRMAAPVMRPLRKKIQMIFQDPFASLNPRRTVGRIIADGPIAHGMPADEAWVQARELLRQVGLDASAAERYPHEFSGGQRQRIGIARALALEPDVLIADEAVSALDVSIQAQVLKLIDDLKQRLSLSILFITHDLRVAAQVCDRIAVMEKGKIVEIGETAAMFAKPAHVYTQSLLAAVPGRSYYAG
jgi:peptide/nickel transport system ATP-binding protein